MIPILFSATETDFTRNGIGRLVDCISCSVTEERNGIYEVELKYPITGRWFDELMAGGIIGVIHDDNHDIQPFDIYRTSAVIDGVVTVNAHHISYRLNNIILQPFTAASASAAIAAITANSVNTNPFTFSTDKSVTADFKIDKPQSVREILWGQEGSLLDIYGPADFKFDKFEVSMLSNRGSDTGVTVRYGKNLTSIQWDRDKSGTCSALAPYWTDGTDIVYLPEIIVQPTSPVTPIVPVPFDMSYQFEKMPTVNELRAAAVSYLDANTPWNPSDTITIDFTALWQTTEYEGMAEIQRVGLCDTVSIYWTEVGIVSEKAKIVKVVFDVLAERFTSMEVGTVQTSYVAITNGVGSDPGSRNVESAPVVGLSVGAGSSYNIQYNTDVVTTLNRAYARKVGKICIFSFVATISGMASTSYLFEIESQYRPTEQMDFIMMSSADGIRAGQLVASTGRIGSFQSISAGTIRGEVVWTIDADSGGSRSMLNIVQDPGTGSLYIS